LSRFSLIKIASLELEELYSRIFMRLLIMISAPTPVSICLITIIQSLVVGCLTWTFMKDTWCILMFLIIYFGGVIVLFIYVCSLSQNTTLQLNSKIIIMIFPLVVVVDWSLLRWRSDSSEITQTEIIRIINNEFNAVAIMLILYLLYGLISVVKVSKFYYGALRQI